MRKRQPSNALRQMPLPVMWRLKKTLLGLALFPLLLSCGQSQGPVMCINHYSSYDDMMSLLAKGGTPTDFPLVFNPSNVSGLSGFTPSFYLNGLCTHSPYHHEMDDLCDLVSIGSAETYLRNGDWLIGIEIKKPRASNISLSLRTYEGKDEAETSVFYKYSYKKTYCPAEIKEFGYWGQYNQQLSLEFISHTKLIVNEENEVYGTIVFSTYFTEAVQSAYLTTLENALFGERK